MIQIITSIINNVCYYIQLLREDGQDVSLHDIYVIIEMQRFDVIKESRKKRKRLSVGEFKFINEIFLKIDESASRLYNTLCVEVS